MGEMYGVCSERAKGELPAGEGALYRFLSAPWNRVVSCPYVHARRNAKPRLRTKVCVDELS